MIPHLLEHLLHVGEAKLAGVMLLQRVQLARGDLVALDSILLGMEGAHVVDKAACDRGRQFYRLPRGSSIRIFPGGKVTARRHFEAGQKFDVALLASDAALADALLFL